MQKKIKKKNKKVLLMSAITIWEQLTQICFIASVIVACYVQLTGNVAHTHSWVPQRSPLWGLNVEMPCATPVGNCVDNHWPRKYFYSSARISRGSTCTQAQQPAVHRSYLHTIFIRLATRACSSRSSSYHIFQLPQAAILKSAWTSAWTDWVTTGLTMW